MLPFLLPLAAPSAFAAEVDCPSSPEAVERALTDAEAAYSGMDESGFYAAVERAKELLSCVDRALSPTVAARYHRIQGILAWAKKDRERAALDFGAARAVDPGYLFPPGLVPPGNVLLQVYGAFDTSTVTWTHLPAPAEGVLYFDGKPTLNRPNNVPTVLQVQDGQGHLGTSVWLLPTDPMVPYVSRKGDRHLGRKIAGGVSAAVGLGLAGWGTSAFLAAQRGEDQYLDGLNGEDSAAYRHDQIVPLQRGALALVAAGGVGLGAGGALLLLDTTGAAVAFRW